MHLYIHIKIPVYSLLNPPPNQTPDPPHTMLEDTSRNTTYITFYYNNIKVGVSYQETSWERKGSNKQVYTIGNLRYMKNNSEVVFLRGYTSKAHTANMHDQGEYGTGHKQCI